ncbi:MAG: LTA synthase family protein [Lachnospiraceae bacterium]|nr:LTA synthase family protein [Lachnospiraceae bacterium]
MKKIELKKPDFRNLKKFKEMNKRDVCAMCNRISVLLHVVACFIGYFIIEWMCRHSFGDAWHYMFTSKKVFLYNVFLIFLTSLLPYLFRRRIFWRMIVAIFWFVCGLINSIVLLERVTPFTGPDLKLVAEGLGVINKYLALWQVIVVVILLLALLAALVLVFIKAPKYRGKMRYLVNVPLIVVSCVLFAGVTKVAIGQRWISTYFGNIAFAYEDYGFPYCLSVTLFDTGVDRPNGYSEKLVERLEVSEGEKKETDKENLPNIIAIQLESFFDPTNVRGLVFSDDPIPNFRKLMANYSSGMYTVPSVGAGTANTEFETLTGMSMRYFGAGEYPYKSVLKEETCESAAYNLGNIGYTSHAIHNNEANFYSRRSVYANLGFNTFTSEEYMDTQTDVNENGWMRDHNLTKYIKQCMESTDNQDFIFTVSVQGHGPYPEEPVSSDPDITVTGAATDAQNCMWEYYANQIYEMDQFIGGLITWLETQDEDVVLLLYGDHLPTMGLTEEDLIKGDLFQTEYVIWDNLGLERKAKTLPAYQVMAEIMDRVNIHEGTLFNFHQKMKNNLYYQIDLQTLQYDILYGKQYVYSQSNPFSPMVLRLGINQVVLDNIEPVVSGTYYINGKNFTQSSKVEINEEIVDTTFVNSERLMITDATIENHDWIDVAQQSNSSTAKVLSRTNSLIYHDKTQNLEKLGDTTGPVATQAVTPEVSPEETPPAESVG